MINSNNFSPSDNVDMFYLVNDLDILPNSTGCMYALSTVPLATPFQIAKIELVGANLISKMVDVFRALSFGQSSIFPILKYLSGWSKCKEIVYYVNGYKTLLSEEITSHERMTYVRLRSKIEVPRDVRN